MSQVPERRFSGIKKSQKRFPTISPSTAEQRLEMAEMLIVEGWQIALEAQKSLDGTPDAPPWKRFMDKDAQFHRKHQQMLRKLQGINR